MAERTLRSPKFYSSAVSGRTRYNPETTEYYDSSSNLVRIEERMQVGRAKVLMWAQTISGSGFAQNWPVYTETVVYDRWGETTYSGTV